MRISDWSSDVCSSDLPAFVFRLIEAYAAAGERLGLSPDEALRLAAATFGGATALLADSGEKPGALAAKVASKGGMTQVGLDILDTDGQLVALMTNVLRAARDRGRELADIARGQGSSLSCQVESAITLALRQPTGPCRRQAPFRRGRGQG